MTPPPPTHACPGLCTRQVPFHLFACRRCWHRLPTRLRTQITRAYRRDVTEHAQAMQEAIAWYREQGKDTQR